MASWLKQSTSVDVGIGPFLDETDGKTAETALTITQADIRLKKNGGAWAQKNAAQTLTHEENGWYEVTLDATDTNTLGLLIVAIHESGALPVWKEYMVVPAMMYDSIVAGTDRLDTNVTHVGDTAQTAGDIMADTNDIQSRLPAALVSGRMDASVGAMAAGVVTATAVATGAIDADALAADAGTEIATAVWASGTRVLTANTNLNDLNAAGVRSALGLASANLDTQLSTIDTVVDAIKLSTDNLPLDPADASVIAGRFDTLDTNLATVDTVVDAMKVQTDKLTFTVANKLDVNVLVINGVTVSGVGTSGDPWGPA